MRNPARQARSSVACPSANPRAWASCTAFLRTCRYIPRVGAAERTERRQPFVLLTSRPPPAPLSTAPTMPAGAADVVTWLHLPAWWTCIECWASPQTPLPTRSRMLFERRPFSCTPTCASMFAGGPRTLRGRRSGCQLLAVDSMSDIAEPLSHCILHMRAHRRMCRLLLPCGSNPEGGGSGRAAHARFAEVQEAYRCVCWVIVEGCG